jgi:2,3-bisphosphoglycerate-independent phosphoglycerate mutase
LKAVRIVDDCVGQLWRACQQNGWAMAVTADHGNIELMVDPVTGEPHTAHTLNPVPFVLCHSDLKGLKLKPGVLADIAPTLCKVMGLAKPAEMNRLGLL